MSRSSIQDVLGIRDPALSYNFSLFLPNIPGSASTRDVTIACQSTSLPGSSLEQVKVDLHGISVVYAGRKTYTHSFNANFLITSDWSIKEKFERWVEFARSWRNNTGSTLAEYSVPAIITLYNDYPAIVKSMRVNNIFPASISDVELDGSQGNALFQQVEFHYTDWDWI